jgi:hypothetical protein
MVMIAVRVCHGAALMEARRDSTATFGDSISVAVESLSQADAKCRD